MDAVLRMRIRRALETRRFDRLATILADVYAGRTTQSLGRAIDGARRCARLMADLQTLRSTIEDLEGEIGQEVTGILRHLDLERPTRGSVLHRLWHIVRPPAYRRETDDPELTASSDHAHQLAAYGLGAFTVLVGGAPIGTWVSRRGETVLKFLLIGGCKPVHREELMASIWPDVPYELARNRLNVAIHGLRKSLSPSATDDFIVFGNGSYAVSQRVDVWFDVSEFEERIRRGRRHRHGGYVEAAMSEFRRAVALYAGDLFTGDKDCEWAEAMRQRLRLHYLEILDELGNEALQVGDLRACMQWSEALLEVEPWHEGAHARLMRAHARNGQPHVAIRQFVECARVLRCDLETMPNRATINLYDQIKRGASV